MGARAVATTISLQRCLPKPVRRYTTSPARRSSPGRGRRRTRACRLHEGALVLVMRGVAIAEEWRDLPPAMDAARDSLAALSSAILLSRSAMAARSAATLASVALATETRPPTKPAATAAKRPNCGGVSGAAAMGWRRVYVRVAGCPRGPYTSRAPRSLRAARSP